MSDKGGSTGQESGNNGNAQAANAGASSQNQSQSLGDQVFGNAQAATQNQPIRYDGMKEGETVEQFIGRLSKDVADVRKEAARYRTRLKELAGDDTPDNDGKTEFQRLQEQLTTLSDELTNERNARKAEKINGQLLTALSRAGAQAPDRAVRMIELSDLELGQDGTPTAESVMAAINDLKAAVPSLFSDTRGGGDGGAGNLGDLNEDFNALIRRKAGVGSR